MISDLAFEGDFRGLREFRYISGIIPYRSAAKKILSYSSINSGTGIITGNDKVLILTGFYISRYESIETDGLTGTWVIAHVLSKLGFDPIIPVDETTRPIFQKLFKSKTLIDYPVSDNLTSSINATRILKSLTPHVVIAIERPGPDSSDRFLNYNGDDITEFTARTEYLFSRDCLTVGIGDGGNELGMGQLAEKLVVESTGTSCPLCRISADYTLIGSTSDFAAFGLSAALEICAGKQILPDEKCVREFLLKTKKLDLVDGITGKTTGSVDGFTIDKVIEKYGQFQKLARNIRVSHDVLNKFSCELDDKYGTAVISVTPRWNSSTENLDFMGYILNESHSRQLQQKLSLAGINIGTKPELLTDLDTNSPHNAWISVQSRQIDLFDRPEGRVTTEITDYDCWVQIIWVKGKWLLIQTPDLAVGWSRSVDLVKNIDREKTNNPWKNILRPVFKDVVKIEMSIDRLHDSAKMLLDIPYRWGGRSLESMDCSGMIQRIFMDQNLLLPKNSR
ncbi:DUF4392 domain-containing protein, partial [bacterium]|nr:DUF4392 domain-containing protein [bacterium]